MSRELIKSLIALREEHPDYREELNMTIVRISPKKSGEHLTNIVDSYISILCNDFGISKKHFLTTRRRNVIYYRYSLIAYLRFNTTMTYKAIGKEFGNKDHSTIINVVDKVKNALHPNSYNPDLSEVFHKVLKALD